MLDGGPLNGGASAELIIDDKPNRSYYVKDSLKPVIGIAFVPDGGGKTHFQLVNTQHWGLPKILNNYECIGCATLPVFILRRKDDPPPDATPKPVS
jgi:hypothetical protein